MTDTIELLETIGRDASLRHASGDDLARALAALQASEGLRQAASTGDKRHLMQELGPLKDPPPNNNPHNGGCDEEEEGGAEEDVPERDGGSAGRMAKAGC